MRFAIVVALLSLTAEAGRFSRLCGRTVDGRTGRGLNCNWGVDAGGGAVVDPYPQFEFAPPDGGGMTAECACSALADSRGNAMAFTRASSAYCTKGWPVSGLGTSSMVLCLTDQPRAMTGGDGGVGLFVEGASTNIALRSQEFEDAAWVLATATVTPNTTVAPDGTTTGETLSDASAVTDGCISQVVLDTSATRSSSAVYVKGDTVLEVRVTQTGTGNSAGDCSATLTGLSTTTWTRAECISPAVYTGAVTAKTITICVGDAAADVGDIRIWQADLTGNLPTLQTVSNSPVLTTSAAATRAGESTSIPISPAIGLSFSLAATGMVLPITDTVSFAKTFARSDAVADTTNASGAVGHGSTSIARFTVRATTSTPGGLTIGTNFHRYMVSSDAGTSYAEFDGVAVSPPTNTGPTLQADRFWIGRSNGQVGTQTITKYVCFDPDATRCR